jgi:DNA-binding response OmpR family regulator
MRSRGAARAVLKANGWRSTMFDNTQSHGTGCTRILLAEDDPDVRAVVAAALRSDHHEVVEEPDGGRLLVRIGAAYASQDPRRAYDLVVSDIRMPTCSGMQILEGLRRARWTTPVILMTAFADSATRARALGYGALLFAKPVDPIELKAAVRRLLSVTSVTAG